MTYSYLKTNTGNVRLANPVTVTDNKLAAVSCPDTISVSNPAPSLNPTLSLHDALPISITQADLNAGSVTNQATAHAGGTDSNQATDTINAQQNPKLTLVKIGRANV